jgi:hypothetical protein
VQAAQVVLAEFFVHQGFLCDLAGGLDLVVCAYPLAEEAFYPVLLEVLELLGVHGDDVAQLPG